MKKFNLSSEPIAYVVTINYKNWKQHLKDQGKKSITVKALLESEYVKNHTIKIHYENLCATFGSNTVDRILKDLYGIEVGKKRSKAA